MICDVLFSPLNFKTMKKYKVIEKRMSVVEYEIEAESEEAAKQLEGEIIDEQETDNYGYDLVSCEEIES